MAKQRGGKKMVGTLDGLNYYIRKGKQIIRTAGGGFDGKRIKNDPLMIRIVENSTEFGANSSFGKQIRQAIRPLFGTYTDGTLPNRVVSVLHKIKLYDIECKRGKRSATNGLQTPMGRYLLEQFAFTPMTVQSIIGGSLQYDSETFTVSFSGIDAKSIRFPNASNQIRIQTGVLIVNLATVTMKMFLSEETIIDRNFELSSFTQTPNDQPTGDGLAIVFVALRSYQVINGTAYPLVGPGTTALNVLPFGF